MRKRQLLSTVRRSFDGDAWHGPAVADALEDVTEAEAAKRPPGGAHSIWELTLHIAAWANEVERRLGGAPATEPEEGDWPVTGGTWLEAKQRLQEARDRLMRRLETFSEEDFDNRVGGERDAALGTGFTYAGMLEGLAQHNAYHAGQIMVLRKIIRAL
jgi:uncharacterized damage-inducible protein DinB